MDKRPDAETIFHQAREMDPAMREGYLKGACGNDVALRSKVDALLKADDEGAGFLKTSEPSLGATIVADPSSEHAGQVIDRYKLLEQIGEGGFGTVWMAEQREPVRRRVALKIIKLGMDTKQVIARFEAERQALAMMDHPNIAKVLDAGATETGRPYFVMEYIRGVPILEYCDTEKLDTRARLDLFTQVCHAIQHAHQKGIIHRDIKPSNVLITMHDGVPVPKVIDFGIAKATNAELTTKTLFTEHHQMIGTPAYMSPEQAEMSGLDIDTRSDIYSLGVLLYELLTGTTPFDNEELISGGFAEMMRIIREVEPHKPSTRLSSLGETGTRTAEQRHAPDSKRLGLQLKGDLDWIVMKCLEKDRTRRYDTANGLAQDIRRHLCDEPVLASPPSRLYRMRKFTRRNKGAVIACTAIALALIAGISVATIGMVQADAQRDRALAEKEKSRLLRHLFGGGQVSLAVLPLENRTGDQEQTFITDGITNALGEDLSRISALQVMPDDSVRTALRMIQARPSLQRVAEALNVDGVVTGWVDRTEPEVHVAIQLVHALTSQNLWEMQYTDKLGNLQAIQNAMSRDIVEALQLDLTSNERARLASARTVAPGAMEAYLKGHHFISQQSRVSLDRSVAFFDRAIEIDPEFAPAYAGRSLALELSANLYYAPLDVLPRAKRDALRAIELDPSLAEAHRVLGNISHSFDWDLDATQSALLTALELDPNSPENHVAYAVFLSSTNQPEKVLEHLDRAMEIDPFVLVTTTDAFFYAPLFCREYERTIDYCLAAIELDPDLWYAYMWLGAAYAETGRINEAVMASERALELQTERMARDPDDSPSPVLYALLGRTYALAGRESESREMLAKLDEIEKSGQFVCPYETATLHLALGELDEAFELFYKAIEVSSPCIPWIGVDPRLDVVRQDDRFDALIESDIRVKTLVERAGPMPKRD